MSSKPFAATDKLEANLARARERVAEAVGIDRESDTMQRVLVTGKRSRQIDATQVKDNAERFHLAVEFLKDSSEISRSRREGDRR